MMRHLLAVVLCVPPLALAVADGPKKSDPADRRGEGPGITWEEIRAAHLTVCGIKDATTVQTQAATEETQNKYKGKPVQWTGEVVDVIDHGEGAYCLRVAMGRERDYRVSVILEKDQKAKALKLRRGQDVTFRGVIEFTSYEIGDIQQGQIVE